MLSEAVVHPVLATSDLAAARSWYADKLGWRPRRMAAGFIEFAVDGHPFAIYETAMARTAQNTVAIWGVADLRATVARLRARGVVFDEYDLDDLRTEDGVATDDTGTLNAWFRDGDGNYIALVERHPVPEDDPEGPGISAMLAASDLGRARDWYAEKLDFVPDEEFEDQLLIYRTGRSRFSVYRTPSAGTAKNTVAAWRVADLRAEVADLRRRGVVFDEVDLGEARTVDGILTDADGESAWFKDSESNILALAQIREPGDS